MYGVVKNTIQSINNESMALLKLSQLKLLFILVVIMYSCIFLYKLDATSHTAREGTKLAQKFLLDYERSSSLAPLHHRLKVQVFRYKRRRRRQNDQDGISNNKAVMHTYPSVNLSAWCIESCAMISHCKLDV